MRIGMLDHLQKWIFHYMQSHEQLDKYKAIWLSVPAYNDLTPWKQAYEEVAQWNRKEMKEMSRNLLAFVTKSLRGRFPAQRPIFNCTIECTQALWEFYMYNQYESHDDATLSNMQDGLRAFHTFNEVASLGWTSNKAKAQANALRTELV